jgi:hypothetical protein
MKIYRFLFILLAIFTFGFTAISQVQAASQAECTFTSNLTVGAVNDPTTNDLVNLQSFLARIGFLTSTAGDIFGPTLRTALASYQAARGISPANGYFGPITRPVLTAECLADDVSAGSTYRLITSTSGTGYGTVTGGGVYNEGALVTLQATPASGSLFSGWNNGRASGKSMKYQFTITEDQVANAVFDKSENSTASRNPRPALTNTAVAANTTSTPTQSSTKYRFTTYLNNAPDSVSSSGSISGTQNAVKTTASNTSVTGTYPAGTRMTLTAKPGPDSIFLTWFGAGPCAGGNPVCSFDLNQDNMGTEAVFKALPAGGTNTKYDFNKLVAVKAPHDYALGLETVNPNGGTINGTVVGSYQAGTLVTMTAVPNAGYQFIGWSNNGLNSQSAWNSGKCHNQGVNCNFVLDTNVIMYALFTPVTNSSNLTPIVAPNTTPNVIPAVTPSATPVVAPNVTPATTPGATGTYDLVVTKAGAAASYGVVTPMGRTSYPAGSSATVTVTITDPSKVKFAGWNDGDVCSGRALTCTLPMTKNQTANANFDFIAPYTSMFSSPSAIYSAIKSALNLQKGSVQSGVAALQKYLNTKGYVVNETPGEAGSPGNESTYFGEKTKQAVVKFQQDNGIPATGVVGAQTKEVMKTK